MTLKERRVGDVTILELKGRLVLDDGNDELRDKIEQLAAEDRVNVIVNLKDVTYVDSCGVGLLIAKYVSLRRRHGDVKLLSLTERSHHLMEISKLLDVFEIFESEEDALASFHHEAQA
jgi:anti-anti-sigma factor